ncbi:MAG: NAD(P)H-binding protein [Planctomycetota bacterium]|jgi:uncharacterized protein YbjT (DUF2867 family)
MDKKRKILVTGATGYIGSHFVPRLLDEGYDVRVMVRQVKKIQNFDWKKNVEVIEADALKPDSLNRALEGISFAYYLILEEILRKETARLHSTLPKPQKLRG